MQHNVTRSKSGLPVIREEGGGMSNTGYATIVCGAQGEKVKPLFVPRGYSNAEHALFVAKVGMLFVDASHNRRGESATAYQIDAIGTADNPDELITSVLYEYEDGDGTFPEWLQEAKSAALKKSDCYHCRDAHYIA